MTMKRTLAITVMCMLLCATVGATAAVAKVNQPAGKSSVYQYTVNIDPAGTGKLVVNMKHGTFTFTGKGCEAGTYYLYYTSSTGDRVNLGEPTAADAYGNLAISGTCTATDAELKTVKVDTTAPPAPIEASLTVDFELFSGTSSTTAWLVDPTASSGPIVKYELTVKYENRIAGTNDPVQDTYVLTGPQEIATFSAYGPVEMTLTVYDAANNKDSMTKTVTPPVQTFTRSDNGLIDLFYPSGSTLGIPVGDDVTFEALESGTWRLYNPEWDPTPNDPANDDDGFVWSTGESVTVHSGLAPTWVDFYKAGSDLTTPDWTADVWYGYQT